MLVLRSQIQNHDYSIPHTQFCGSDVHRDNKGEGFLRLNTEKAPAPYFKRKILFCVVWRVSRSWKITPKVKINVGTLLHNIGRTFIGLSNKVPALGCLTSSSNILPNQWWGATNVASCSQFSEITSQPRQPFFDNNVWTFSPSFMRKHLRTYFSFRVESYDLITLPLPVVPTVVDFLDPDQKSNFPSVQTNTNHQECFFSLISIRFDSWEARLSTWVIKSLTTTEYTVLFPATAFLVRLVEYRPTIAGSWLLFPPNDLSWNFRNCLVWFDTRLSLHFSQHWLTLLLHQFLCLVIYCTNSWFLSLSPAHARNNHC